MALTAATDKVIIVPDDTETQTEWGLFIANGKNAPGPTTGTVHSVGKPDVFTMEGLEAGDRVAFPDMAGAEVNYEGVKYFILSYNEVLAVLG